MPDPLALAAGELVGIAVGVVGLEPDQLEDVGHLGVDLGPAALAVDGQRLGDGLAHGHARIERGERVLEDDLDVAPHAPHLRAAQCGQLDAVELDRPDVGLTSWRMARPVVDFPQPDSPTRPSVSPSEMVKETPDTACTAPTVWRTKVPPRNGNCFDEVGDLEQRLPVGPCRRLSSDPCRSPRPSWHRAVDHAVGEHHAVVAAPDRLGVVAGRHVLAGSRGHRGDDRQLGLDRLAQLGGERAARCEGAADRGRPAWRVASPGSAAAVRCRRCRGGGASRAGRGCRASRACRRRPPPCRSRPAGRRT